MQPTLIWTASDFRKWLAMHHASRDELLAASSARGERVPQFLSRKLPSRLS